MAVTPKGIVTPDPSSPYNLVTDLSTLASTADAAIVTQKGTASQRSAARAGAPEGTLWQDTDGIKMIWRKEGSAWVPAVWRWGGTTAQMNSFSQAPQGFAWYNVSDNNEYLRVGGSWRGGSGSLPLSLGTGTLTWKARNGIVEVYWIGTGSYPTGASQLSNALIPAGLRPVGGGAVRGSASLNANAAASLYVSSGGQVGIINSTGSSRTGGEGSAIYFI